MTAAQLSREAVAINQIQMAHNATNHGSSCLTEYRRIRRTANSPAEFRKILEQIHLAESALCSARENIEMALPVIEQQAVDLEDADICKMDTGEGPCNEQTDHGVEFVGHQYIGGAICDRHLAEERAKQGLPEGWPSDHRDWAK